MENIGQNNVNINIFEYPEEVCSECGHNVFAPGLIFKMVPGIALGQGSGTVSVPIKVAYCAKCGALSPADKKVYDEAMAAANSNKTREAVKQNAEDVSSIII